MHLLVGQIWTVKNCEPQGAPEDAENNYRLRLNKKNEGNLADRDETLKNTYRHFGIKNETYTDAADFRNLKEGLELATPGGRDEARDRR